MKYRIELAATAKADIRGQAQWLGGEVSPAAAEKWLSGLYKAIDSLQTRPLRCPFAAENDRFPADIRELL
jgi:plasmid stabilization system protein ParE